MNSPAKPIRKIFAVSATKEEHQFHMLSPKTPKRKPIFSQQKYPTQKKHKQIEREVEVQSKKQIANFLHKMTQKVEIKNNLVKQIEQQNIELQKQNHQLQIQNIQILKRISVCGGLSKLKQKNSEYRTKLLKAQSLLYQLRMSSKKPIKGIDQLIQSLHI